MWYDRNSFENNEDYAIRVLERFGISKYYFIADGYGGLSLLISKNLHSYKIDCDKNREEMVIKRKVKKNEKEYLREVKSFKIDSIYEVIKWIFKDSQMVL